MDKLDLFVEEQESLDELSAELLPNATALATWGSFGCFGSAACVTGTASTASCVSTASSFSAE